MKTTVSIFGLGKLGAPMVASFAEKGHPVVGVDIDSDLVGAIDSGRTHLQEPGLAELLERNAGRIRATTDSRQAILDTDISFVIVPTPSGPDGAFDPSAVVAACRNIGDALKEKSAPHLIVITSTVMPGTTDGVIRVALEESSGRRCGADFGLCYSPEFIALGSVLRDLLAPDFFLIGESDASAGLQLAEFYRGVCDNAAPSLRMNFINAELTKLGINAFVTTKITFANMLARMSERTPGANADIISAAIGQDRRIGPMYLRGALGYGGPCFPRDNYAFARAAAAVGAPADLALAVDASNRDQNAHVLAWLLPHIRGGARVSVLGLAYKPHTSVVEASQSVMLAASLDEVGMHVVCHDPQATLTARDLLGSRVQLVDSLPTALAGAEVVIVATPWPEYLELCEDDFVNSAPRVLIVDCWRVLDRTRLGNGVDYLALGCGPDADNGNRSPSHRRRSPRLQC